MRALALGLLLCLLASDARAASVLTYGAIGNGIADDTVAIQSALDTSADVYFPAGTYLVRGLWVQFNHSNIHGDGPASILLLSSYVSGTLLNANAHDVSVHDLSLSGGNDVSHNLMVDPASVRNGIIVSAESDSSVHQATIHGFDSVGIWAVDITSTTQTTLSLSDVAIYDCWDALLIGRNSEYVHLANADIHHNRYGLDVEAGNFSGVNVKLNDNGYGLYLYGGSNPNNGHGNLTGSQITHSVVYSVYAIAVSIGFNLSANQIHDGDVYLFSSRGINISGGTMDVNNYFLDGGGANAIRGNFIYGAYQNNFVHNAGGHPDATIVADNFQ